MRDVEGRLAAYRNNPSKVPGRCAERVMLALDVPRQGLPDATAMGKAVPPGKMQKGRAPRGSIVYWDRGDKGHGHVCFALGDGTELSVDVVPNQPGVAGVVPFTWFAKNWPALRYLGWSWYWGSLDTQPKEAPVSGWTVGQDKLIRKDGVKVTAGKYNAVAQIVIPKPGSYVLTFQTRLPAGRHARWQFTRVGWGADPDGRDETGPNPLTPPDGKATSFTHTHRIEGGGPIDFEIKVAGTGTVTLPYIIAKAERIT